MSLQVINADEGHFQRPGQRLCGGYANQERPHQTGPIGNGDLIDIRQFQPGLLYRLIHHRQDIQNMIPGSYLRHHAAKLTVNGHLSGYYVCQQLSSAPEDSRCRLVTAGLYSQGDSLFRRF